jgi:hypothetical protein
MAIFTLAAARSLLPQVREITQQYYDRVEELRERADDVQASDDLNVLEQHMQNLMQEWASEIVALGVEVKGLWLADFDSGDGYYYCWKLGEDDIEHFHRYELGFAGRRPIALLDQHA